MVIRRFFVSPQQISGDIITITDDEHNHLKNVLRLVQGEEIIVVCGDEWDYYATIENVAKSSTICRVVKKEINEHNPKNDVTVFLGISKKDTLYSTVAKLTELGVSNFSLLKTQFITAKDNFSKLEKLENITNQSIKQCKRSKPMNILKTVTINELCQKIKEFDVVVFANELESNVSLNELFLKNKSYNSVALVVGSEGGFSKTESDLLIKAGAKSVSLGKRILKVETACTYLTSCVMFLLGEND